MKYRCEEPTKKNQPCKNIVKSPGLKCHFHSLYETDSCPICLEPLQEGKRLICGHTFHEKCIYTWLEKKMECAICRRPISDKRTKNWIESHRDLKNDPEWAPTQQVEEEVRQNNTLRTRRRRVARRNAIQRRNKRITFISEFNNQI